MEREFENEVISRLAKIETKIDNIEKIKEDATKALYKSESNEEKIAEIKDNQRWTWRTIAALIFAYAIDIIIKMKG